MQKPTDWDSYYDKPFKATSVTRKITSSVIFSGIERFFGKKKFQVLELGGANSCFYDSFVKKFKPSQYSVIDNNESGLQKLRDRAPAVNCTYGSVLDLGDLSMKADLVYSVGLIEHFQPEELDTVIASHFKFVESGGLVIITFPTPTFLYRITRKVAEMLDLWIFHDETPLKFKEVESYFQKYGDVIEKKIIWPIFLTQYFVMIRKH